MTYLRTAISYELVEGGEETEVYFTEDGSGTEIDITEDGVLVIKDSEVGSYPALFVPNHRLVDVVTDVLGDEIVEEDDDDSLDEITGDTSATY